MLHQWACITHFAIQVEYNGRYIYFKCFLDLHVVECSMETFMCKDFRINLSVFIYMLFHEDFSSTVGVKYSCLYMYRVLYVNLLELSNTCNTRTCTSLIAFTNICHEKIHLLV